MSALLVCASLVGPTAMGSQVPGEVRGRVTSAPTGLGVANARIEVIGHATAAVTDVGGSFVLRGLEPGMFDIRVRAVGHIQRDTTVVVANGRSSTLDVALQPIVSRLDAVVVQSTRDSANAITFDRAAIEQSGRRDLGELLRGVPGVVVTRDGGPGAPSRISIRGSAASEVLVLVNGAPINSAISGDADVSSIGLERAERVQVLTGAQSARYGGRALAGVVIVETRRAQQELSGAASVGAWGERNASVSAGQATDRGDIRAATAITGDFRDARGDFSYDVPDVRGGGTARRFNADARSIGVLVTSSIDRVSEPGGVQLRAEWQRRSRGLPGSIVQPSVTGRQHDSRVSSGVDGRWPFSRLTVTANVDATTEHAVFADPTPPFGSVYDDAIDANTLMASSTATAGSPARSISVGGEARTIGVTSTMLAANAPRRQRQAGVWSTAHVASVLAGATDLAADLSVRGDWDSLLDDAVISPRAVLSATRGVGLISASFGGGYNPPSLADQFFHEGVLVRANPSLRPERVRREFEVRAALRDVSVAGIDFGGELAAYRADIDGMILWQPNFQFIWSPSNFDVRRSGWETSARVAIPSIGADVRGSLTRTDVAYTGPVLSGQVAYRPRSTGNFAAGVSRWQARVETTTRFIGARRTVPGSGLNMLDAYSLTDVTLSRPFVRAAWQIDARVTVENVFDRSASMLVDYPFPGRAWTVGLRVRRR